MPPRARTANGSINGAPVTLIFLIRNDGDGTRLPQGEYFAQQLETLGFTVDSSGKEILRAFPHLDRFRPRRWPVEYIHGWLGFQWPEPGREEHFPGNVPARSVDGYPYTLVNVPDPVFQQVGDDLATANFTTLQQRHDLMVQALTLALQDSLQVWTVDLQTYAPFNCNLQVSADVGAGVETTKMSPYTMRIKDQVGGQVKVGSTATMFTDPWNPVNGSNWVTSAYVQNAVQGGLSCPILTPGFPGHCAPRRPMSTVQTGLPVASSSPLGHPEHC